MDKKPGFRIERVWCYVSVDPADGEEGVCSVQRGDIHWPMVAADEKRRDAFRPYAQEIARATGMRIRLIELSTRREIEVIE
jgi:hypothetical protein